MSASNYPDFSGKHVCFFLSGRAKRSYMIQDIRFEVQAGKLFAVGRVSEAYEEDVWGKGAVVALEWDSVEQYLQYDSVEHYRQELVRFDAARAAAKEAKRNKKAAINESA